MQSIYKQSTCPRVPALYTATKIGHWFISATSLQLVKGCVLALAISAGKESVAAGLLLENLELIVGPAGSHLLILHYLNLLLLFITSKLLGIGDGHINRREEAIENTRTQFRILRVLKIEENAASLVCIGLDILEVCVDRILNFKSEFCCKFESRLIIVVKRFPRDLRWGLHDINESFPEGIPNFVACT